MKYSRFEFLALLFGGSAVVATVATSVLRKADWVEIVAQLLLLGVLVGALHWGRRGGFIMGLAAMVAYVGLRIPTIGAGSLTPALAQLLITRAAVYGVVGIIGGELCTRIKYFFLKLEGNDYIDDVTHLYNASYLHKLLRSHMAQYDRYQAPFSVVLLRIPEASLPPLRKTQGKRVLRETAQALLGDIRLSDEMGRFDGASLCVLLPNTPREGGRVAAVRLAKTTAAALDRRGIRLPEAVRAEVLGCPEDRESITALLPPQSDTDLPGR